MNNKFSTKINNTQPLISKADKERKLNQHSKVLWFTGLSGSGKSTTAFNLEKELQKRGFFIQLFDGDILRNSLNRDLGFSAKDREENIRRVAEISKMFLYSGIIVINSFISPTAKIREYARNTIGTKNFIEIFINTPIEICEKRDIKGLYQKARQGKIKNFTGIDAPYEPPVNPEIEIKGNELTIEESTSKILDYILPQIKFSN